MRSRLAISRLAVSWFFQGHLRTCLHEQYTRHRIANICIGLVGRIVGMLGTELLQRFSDCSARP
jgi:hypothetical protein